MSGRPWPGILGFVSVGVGGCGMGGCGCRWVGVSECGCGWVVLFSVMNHGATSLKSHSAGAPHQNLSKGMEDEHCVKTGNSDEFVTGNYGVQTNPRWEYEIASGRRTCPAEQMLNKKGRKVRAVRSIEELMSLKIAIKAGLTEDEILAVVRPPLASIIQCNTHA